MPDVAVSALLRPRAGVSRLIGFGQSPEDHVFVTDGATVAYECKCRFIDVFEGETYLAWSEECRVHWPKPAGYLDDLKGAL